MQVAFYFAGKITQVLDAIPWVRCASGNVFRAVWFDPGIERRLQLTDFVTSSQSVSKKLLAVSSTSTATVPPPISPES